MQNNVPHRVFFSPDQSTNSGLDFHIPLTVLAGKAHEHMKRHGNFKQTARERNVSMFESPDELWVRLICPEEDQPFEEIAYLIYNNLFAKIQNQDKSLVRIWNYIPQITNDQGDLERYRHFNVGRRRAWEESGPKDNDGRLLFPAATVIGSLGGGLRLEAFLSRHPITFLQNPRQTAPALYSKKYGPVAPLFARGAILQSPHGDEFFISGTASIRGEDVVHIDDPVLQTQEALTNINVLMSLENCRAHGYAGSFGYNDIQSLRVYVKNPAYLDSIRGVVEQSISAPIIYLHDDICRKDLLVEIEGVCKK